MKDSNLVKKEGTIIPFIQNGEYFFEKGISAYRKKDLNKAVQLMKRATSLSPDESVFHCQLAAILAEQGEFEESNTILSFVLKEIDSEMYECHFFMANNYAYMGLFDDAEHEARSYIDQCPDGEFVNDTKDLLDLMRSENDEDETTTEEDRLIVQHERARRCLEDGYYAEAERILKSLVEEYPAFWTVHFHLAEAYVQQGRMEEAIALYHNVLDQDGGNVTARCHLANTYVQDGRVAEAEAIAAQLESVYPLDPQQRYRLAQTFCVLERYEQALERFILLEKGRFDDADFYHCLAVAAFHSGQTNRAITSWRKAEHFGDERSSAYLRLVEQGVLTKEEVRYQF